MYLGLLVLLHVIGHQLAFSPEPVSFELGYRSL